MMPWLLVVGGQEQGSSYASGMKEAAGLSRAAEFVVPCYFDHFLSYIKTLLQVS
jgi:hypothetical protein